MASAEKPLPITIGMLADDFIIALVQHFREIARVRFLLYPVLPDLQTRLAAHPVPIGFDTATREAAVHVESGRRYFALDRDAVTREAIDEMLAEAHGDVALGVSSEVTLTGGQIAHIAMMDFKVGVSALNERTLVELFRNELTPQGGVILDSGNSYHYYGLRLLNRSSWDVFLGRCLLMTPLVDTRYIAHRLIEGFCILRISKTRTKTKVPIVVDWW